MFVSPETIEILTRLGVQGAEAVEVIRAFEADMLAQNAPLKTASEQVQRKRAADRDRMRQRRERRATVALQSGDTECDNGSSLSPPPTPPTTNLSPVAPYSPPKPAKPAPLAEQIFLLQPKQFRRSTTPDIRSALIAATKRGADGAQILEALTAYYRTPASLEDSGKYAKGAHRLIERDRWRDYLPAPEPPAQPATEAEHAWRLQHYRDTREWRSEWGERPRDAA